MKTAIIRLRLADTIARWCDSVGTRLHHQLVLADSLWRPSRLTSRGRPRSPWVAARDAVIDCNLRLSNLEIVRKLDLELAGRDGSVGLPESWTGRPGVTSYKEAYKDARCQRRLRSMFAKRRRISRLP